MSSLIEFSGDWSAEEKQRIKDAISYAEQTDLAAYPDTVDTPWTAIHGVIKEKLVYAACRSSVDHSFLGRTASDLSTRIRQAADDHADGLSDSPDRPYVQIAYMSTAADDLTDEELRDILQVARANNAELGVTGLLLYAQGRFLQVLEGPETTVSELYATIKEDPRHVEVETLMETSVSHRTFPEWKMGLERLDMVATEEGASPFLITGDLETESTPAETLVKLLDRFHRTASGHS